MPFITCDTGGPTGVGVGAGVLVGAGVAVGAGVEVGGTDVAVAVAAGILVAVGKGVAVGSSSEVQPTATIITIEPMPTRILNGEIFFIWTSRGKQTNLWQRDYLTPIKNLKVNRYLKDTRDGLKSHSDKTNRRK